jgi:hypothetical protein
LIHDNPVDCEDSNLIKLNDVGAHRMCVDVRAIETRHAMKLLDILAKLGILRFGFKKAVYTSGRDRPIEFMSSNVFNAERDLTTVADVKRAFGVKTASKPSKQKS